MLINKNHFRTDFSFLILTSRCRVSFVSVIAVPWKGKQRGTVLEIFRQSCEIQASAGLTFSVGVGRDRQSELERKARGWL